MADEKSSVTPSTASSDRAETQNLGGGVEEMNLQQAPNRDEARTFEDERGREVAGSQSVGDLGVGTPPGVDVHNLGQPDKPQEEWGEPAGEAATFSSNNSRKGLRTEAERGQGAKTRQANKDIVSRRT